MHAYVTWDFFDPHFEYIELDINMKAIADN